MTTLFGLREHTRIEDSILAQGKFKLDKMSVHCAGLDGSDAAEDIVSSKSSSKEDSYCNRTIGKDFIVGEIVMTNKMELTVRN